MNMELSSYIIEKERQSAGVTLRWLVYPLPQELDLLNPLDGSLSLSLLNGRWF